VVQASQDYTSRFWFEIDKKVPLCRWRSGRQLAKMQILKTERNGLPNLKSANAQDQPRRESSAVELETIYLALRSASKNKN